MFAFRAGRGHNGRMSDTVAQIKARLSIADVVGGYVTLQRAGSSLRARCPFHSEKTPSFHVSPERGTYHCFGCGTGGDIITFVQEIEGLDFKGALKMLAERAGVPLVFEKGSGEKDTKGRLYELMEAATLFYATQLGKEDSVRAYLNSRGVSEASIQTFRLGFAPALWHEVCAHLASRGFSEREILDAGLSKKGDRGAYDRFRSRIMFPMADSAGRIVAFSGRIFDSGHTVPADTPKYINSPETPLYKKSALLYGFDRAKQAIRKHNCAVLVEGQMDLVAAHQHGWSNTVAVSGTAFTEEHAALIQRMTDNLLIALDADEAGIKAAARAARAALKLGLHVKIVQLPSGVDPADLFLCDGGEEVWRQAAREAKDIVEFLLDTLQERGKGHDVFRRSVEVAVIPFLADVQSPIERDVYVRLVAGRIGVSEAAVAEALSNVPRPAEGASQTPEAPKIAREQTRTQQAIGVLFWQESLDEPAIPVATLKAHIERVVGEHELNAARSLDAAEQERLRFIGEQFFAHSHGDVNQQGFLRDVEALLAVVERERLQEELAEVTALLRYAEGSGDEQKTQEYTARLQLLTGEIARMSKVL